jgi:hypothetical protein
LVSTCAQVGLSRCKNLRARWIPAFRHSRFPCRRETHACSSRISRSLLRFHFLAGQNQNAITHTAGVSSPEKHNKSRYKSAAERERGIQINNQKRAAVWKFSTKNKACSAAVRFWVRLCSESGSFYAYALSDLFSLMYAIAMVSS